MFELEDQTYTRIPNYMPAATALAAVARIEEYANARGLDAFTLVLHGGEPTLWATSDFTQLVDAVAGVRQRGLDLGVSLQTNAFRYDPALFDLLASADVGIGISVDGPPAYHDTTRLDRAGGGTYDAVMANVRRMLDDGHGDMIGGFLSVADPRIPPTEYLDWVASLPITRVSLLWPIEYNHQASPPLAADNETPLYGSWFADVFAEWWRRDDPDLHVRHFFDVITRRFGSAAHGDSIGNDSNEMLVINTDGGYEYPDYYRAFADGGSRTASSVFREPLAVLELDPVFDFNLNLGQHLPLECQGCRHVTVCGGGFLPGRMSVKTLLPIQRSVLCSDQMAFFDRVDELVPAP